MDVARLMAFGEFAIQWLYLPEVSTRKSVSPAEIEEIPHLGTAARMRLPRLLIRIGTERRVCCFKQGEHCPYDHLNQMKGIP
jgi:hypothetical protein